MVDMDLTVLQSFLDGFNLMTRSLNQALTRVWVGRGSTTGPERAPLTPVPWFSGSRFAEPGTPQLLASGGIGAAGFFSGR